MSNIKHPDGIILGAHYDVPTIANFLEVTSNTVFKKILNIDEDECVVYKKYRWQLVSNDNPKTLMAIAKFNAK